ncbi:MAG: acyl carrier protein [Candidatus Omnitrophica bacterium]|nr:acyl carrier protein [Candidatus Omnitrophota bacterium]MBU1366490.1 acyl carrier protein [Candidatus Omnitrophota bacterium]MBU1523959.1 acyl carrier protein [Candidatus Omnitrophota bacterium]MBU2437043.1 acyl carrier protein [Candidatus Omnitrophota bacterium]MBU2504860.1 acyl carrier protein [Candidatus Omnitrophota bacterium]
MWTQESDNRVRKVVEIGNKKEMLTKDIEEILIREVATILSTDTAEIVPDVPLHTLGVDSLSFVELLVFIEKEFNLKLMESGLTREDFQSIRSLSACISKAN